LTIASVTVIYDPNFQIKITPRFTPLNSRSWRTFDNEGNEEKIKGMTATVFLVLLTFYLILGVSGLKLHHCPSGFYCAKSMLRSSTSDGGYQMPRPCPRGTWSGAGAVKCTDCEKGYYTRDEASTSCERCEPGHMCPVPDADPELCPLGTYSLDPAQICCKVCQSGSYTPRVGSTGCTQCHPGTYCPKNEVKLSCANDTGMS